MRQFSSASAKNGKCKYHFLTFQPKTERNLYGIVYSHDQKDQIFISCCEFMPSLHVCLCLHKYIFIVHTAPWAVWPAICPFSTMHCGIPLLNPGVKNEHVAITRALSSQKKSTPHSNWPSLLKPGWSFPQPIVLKEDGKVVVEGDKRIWPCANLPLSICLNVCG